VISPAGTGLIYLTSASRIGFGLSRNGYVPEAFEKSSPKTKIPVFGVISRLSLACFSCSVPELGRPGGRCDKRLGAHVRRCPVGTWSPSIEQARAGSRLQPARRQGLSPLAFVFANFIVYWSGWSTYSTLMVAMVIGYILMAVSRCSTSTRTSRRSTGGSQVDLSLPDRARHHLLLR